MPIFDDYISIDTTPLYRNMTGNAKKIHLLWGDGVEILQDGDTRTKVRTRGRNMTGYVKTNALGGKSLLEIYLIDVGQGDGILIKTPKFKHIMIDGGYPRKYQDTYKSAADFVDWKFNEDYKKDQITIDAMIATHCDSDHYGGLWDLLNVEQSTELDCDKVWIKSFYHAGLSRWKKLNGKSGNWLGPYEIKNGEKFLTQLIDSRDQIIEALNDGPNPQLQGWWKDFLQSVVDAKWTNNQPTSVNRISDKTGFLPDYNSSSSGEPIIKVLAPVEFSVNGKPGLHRFTGGVSKNSNGNSVLLRIDFGRTRTLLTGDLNRKSMKALLNDYAGRRQEFECDVCKACHHGSDDVDYEFLKAMNPAVTMVSSGDNEQHDHPRPNIISAMATTGYFQMDNNEIVSPLIYSTELARSVSFGRPFKLDEKDTGNNVISTLEGDSFKRSIIHFNEQKPGNLSAKKKKRKIKNTYVVAGIIYGLINIRTDGEKILCAIMNEKNGSWQIQNITSRF